MLCVTRKENTITKWVASSLNFCKSSEWNNFHQSTWILSVVTILNWKYIYSLDFHGPIVGPTFFKNVHFQWIFFIFSTHDSTNKMWVFPKSYLSEVAETSHFQKHFHSDNHTLNLIFLNLLVLTFIWFTFH